MGRKVLIGVFSGIIVLLVILLLVGISPGLRGAGGSRVPDQQSGAYEFPLTEVNALDLQVASDNVRIVPGRGNTVRVEQRSDGNLPDARLIRCAVEGGTLRVEAGAGTGNDWVFFGHQPISEITIQLPPDAGLPVSTVAGAGDLDIQDLRLGQLRLDAGAGSIALSNLTAGAVSAHTSAGDISVQESSLKTLNGSSGVGSIRVTDAAVADAVQLETSSGDVDFTGNCSSYTGDTSVGNVTADVSGAKTVSGSSSAGDVELICREAGHLAQVKADSSVGNVTVGLPPGTQINLVSGKGMGQIRLDEEARFEVSKEGVEVDMHSSAGDLQLCAAE